MIWRLKPGCSGQRHCLLNFELLTSQAAYNGALTQEALPILHSDKDQLSALNLEHLYESYKLIAAYLAYLDTAQIPDNKR